MHEVILFYVEWIGLACFHPSKSVLPVSRLHAYTIYFARVDVQPSYTVKVKEKLKESMCLILEAAPYLTVEALAAGCDHPQCNCHTVQENSDDQFEYEAPLPSLLKLAVGAVLSYVTICLGQFEGYVSHSSRQVRMYMYCTRI